MADKMKTLLKRFRMKLDFYEGQVYCLRGLRLPKTLDLRRTPIAKKCRHVDNHVNFSFMLEVFHHIILDCSIHLAH